MHVSTGVSWPASSLVPPRPRCATAGKWLNSSGRWMMTAPRPRLGVSVRRGGTWGQLLLRLVFLLLLLPTPERALRNVRPGVAHHAPCSPTLPLPSCSPPSGGRNVYTPAPLLSPAHSPGEERARAGVSPGEVQGIEVVRKAGLKSWPGRPFAGRIQTDDSASLSLSFLLHQIGLKCQPTWAVVWTQGVRSASPGVQHAAGAH